MRPWVRLVPALVVLAACSPGAGKAELADNEVRLDEWSIEGDLDVPAGTTLHLENTGTIQHNVAVSAPGSTGILAGSDNIAADASGPLDLTGLAPGSYQVWCTLPEHAAEGMVNTLVIRAPAPG
jgi:hypothetical protein